MGVVHARSYTTAGRVRKVVRYGVLLGVIMAICHFYASLLKGVQPTTPPAGVNYDQSLQQWAETDKLNIPGTSGARSSAAGQQQGEGWSNLAGDGPATGGNQQPATQVAGGAAPAEVAMAAPAAPAEEAAAGPAAPVEGSDTAAAAMEALRQAAAARPEDAGAAATALKQAVAAAVVDPERLAAAAARRKKAQEEGRFRVPWAEGPPPPAAQVCADTCATAKNGVCEEGRPREAKALGEGEADPEVYPATCDLGTDCADCGAWAFQGLSETQQWRPVEELKAKGLPVNVRQVATPRSFWIAYTSPELDESASKELNASALIDGGDTSVWYQILKQGCVAANGERRLALDVGSKGFGYFALLAATMGCRVVAWEPVPHFASFLRYSLLRNNLTHMVELRSKAVTDEPGPLPVVVPRKGWWVTAGVHGVNIDAPNKDVPDAFERIEVEAEWLDDVVAEDVLLMVVDVQGFEPWVLKSGKELLNNFLVESIVLEYSPAGWERMEVWDRLEQYPSAVARLANSGYTVYHLTSVDPVWEGEMANTLEVVTKDILKHDIEDVYRLVNGTLGCPLPPELANMAGMWACNAIPEALHPHSFRSTFQSSTRVWAVRDDADAALLPRPGQPASLFPLEQDLRTFYTVRTWGTGRRLCKNEEPRHRVMNRCSCKRHRDCRLVEVAVYHLAEQGKMPPLDPPQLADVDSLRLDNW